MKRCILIGLGLVAGVAPVAAHPSVQSGPAVANTNGVVKFGVGHGCAGALAGDPNGDTIALKIDIPASVTGVRPVPSTFGRATVQKTGTVVNSVTFTKAVADELLADDNYYEVSVRLKPPNAPFAQVLFTVTQTCKYANGTIVTEVWDQPPTATTGLPAAVLTVLPARLPGWNKYVIGETTHVPDMTPYFQDAQIVWRGQSAYSFNPVITTMIGMTPGVTALTGGVHPGDEIWVKY